MERVAEWQLANPSKHVATDWTQGAGYTGMMALSRISKDPRFRQAMITMAEGNRWKPGPLPYHADDFCVTQTYLELYLETRDPQLIGPTRRAFDRLIAHPVSETLDFDQVKDPSRLEKWSWCDSLFMAPPALMRLYAATGDKSYLDYTVEHWWKTSDYLYDSGEHLFYRDSSFFGRREANGQKVFWSRGNGWVIAGSARVLQYLPKDHGLRPRFIQQFKDMADRIILCQQPDGLWRASLLDPENFPLKETSGSGFFCFALAWGVNEGILDRARFSSASIRAWNALVSCVAADGKLTHVQPIGSDPRRFADDATETYGTGAFLLAGSEMYRLRQSK